MRHIVERHDDSSNRPLTEPVFLILASLADQPRHGYALMQDIQRMSQQRVLLSTGTLYGALRRLLEEGWIARFSQEDASREKQTYQLTPEGRRQLEFEVGRMKQLMQIASTRLNGTEA